MVYAADLGSVATSVEVRILSKAKMKLVRLCQLSLAWQSLVLSPVLVDGVAGARANEPGFAWRSLEQFLFRLRHTS